MDSYFLEILIRQRQQELEEEFKRIHLARALRNSDPGILKQFILGFFAIFFPKRTRMQNQYCPTIKPELIGNDSCSIKRQCYSKPSE